VDSCITSRQQQDVQACSRGIWAGKLLSLPAVVDADAIDLPDLLPKNFNLGTLVRDETSWWLFSTGLVLCKCIQARLIDWHISNLEIQDRSVYSDVSTVFWPMTEYTHQGALCNSSFFGS
jgi:hypothetical protein